MIIFWIILIIAALAFLIVLDYQLGKKYHEKKDTLKKYPLRSGDITIFTGGDDLFPSYFSDIENAHSSIHILFFIVKDDAISHKFFELLEKKARAGVDVRLLLDWIGGHHVSKNCIKSLKRAGVQVIFSHRLKFPFTFYSLQQRNHRKITVIDEEVGYIGGFNIGKEYLNQNPSLSPWRDYHLRISGDSVHDLQYEFSINWYEESGHQLDLATPELQSESGNVKHQFLSTGGTDLEKMIGDWIDQAHSDIKIGTPYFIPTENIHRKLIAAIKRGVRITVLVPKKPDHMLVKEASFCYFRDLLRHGVNIYQYSTGFYHAKIIVIDHKLCMIGTANFDRRSFLLNDEISCLIYDETFIKKALTIFTYDLQHGNLLTKEDLYHLDLVTKVKEWSARAVSNFL
ncbi:cardiolipin synthase [Bacillus ginsengihumi]|uniref:Cardiolipin synthase n=1 Tax=Heyndrickxia ginsengihumi TaxID=363870 RepID=A0A6M0P1E8_9BACI|nr:cardiolipin synthase [Heyndrickxia ginsengihumi]NEY18424.1 cardiolipin synthase [Heyndrickxia ginsengihumi]